MTDTHRPEESRILAETALFTLEGRPRIYPANILLECHAPGCNNMFWAHLPYAKYCSNSCRCKMEGERRKERNHLRWARDRKKKQIEAQKPAIAERVSTKLFRGTTTMIHVATPTDQPQRNQRDEWRPKQPRPTDPPQAKDIWADDYDGFLDVDDDE